MARIDTSSDLAIRANLLACNHGHSGPHFVGVCGRSASESVLELNRDGVCSAASFAVCKPLEQHDAGDGKDLEGQSCSIGNVQFVIKLDCYLCSHTVGRGYGRGINLLVGNVFAIPGHAHDGGAS